MRNLILLISFSLLFSSVNGKVVETDLNPDVAFTFSLPITSTYADGYGAEVDVDNDGTDDFDFYYEIISGIAGTTWKVSVHPLGKDNQVVWKNTIVYGSNHYAKGLSKGDSVSSNSLFGKDYFPYLGTDVDNNIMGKGENYIGVKFVKGGKTYYGWILVEFQFKGKAGGVLVKSYGYDDQDGRGVKVGVLCTNKTYSSIDTSACDQFKWNGATYTKTGTYEKILTNSQGCDSILTLRLKINSSTITRETARACYTYDWRGDTYTQSGIYKDTLTSFEGCDSILELRLTIDTATSSYEYQEACNQFVWRTRTLTASGVYRDTITNSNGCDSILTLELALGFSEENTSKITACDSFNWKGVEYYSSWKFRDTFLSTSGCDSIVIWDVTIAKATASTEVVNACDAYHWNGETYNQTGMYSDTVVGATGCDSVLWLDLTVQEVKAEASFDGKTFTATTAGAQYQWLNCADNLPIGGADQRTYSPTQDGDYAVVVKENDCSDTSICYNVVLLGVDQVGNSLDVNVYPNPAHSYVVITGDLVGANLYVRDMLGRQHLTEKGVENHSVKLQLESLIPGVYILEVEQGALIYTHKLMVE